jgi:ParB family chromosome partitioning protein
MKQKISDKKQAVTVETPATVETKQASPEVIQHIELSMIACSPFNPRKYRNEEELEELTRSIVNFGIIQPVTLRAKDEAYEIVCGERRYRASLKAGLPTIPAIVKNCSDEEAMEICILENLQRRDINPVEEADSFGKLMEVRNYSIDDLVKQFGKTDKYIRSRLQLRNLVDEVAELLVKEEITLGIALELARFCPDIQKDVYREHLNADDSYSWRRLQTKEFRKLLEKGYSADLSNYEFDKSDCTGCRSNSSPKRKKENRKKKIPSKNSALKTSGTGKSLSKKRWRASNALSGKRPFPMWIFNHWKKNCCIRRNAWQYSNSD